MMYLIKERKELSIRGFSRRTLCSLWDYDDSSQSIISSQLSCPVVVCLSWERPRLWWWQLLMSIERCRSRSLTIVIYLSLPSNKRGNFLLMFCLSGWCVLLDTDLLTSKLCLSWKERQPWSCQFYTCLEGRLLNYTCVDWDQSRDLKKAVCISISMSVCFINSPTKASLSCSLILYLQHKSEETKEATKLPFCCFWSRTTTVVNQ